MEDRMLRHIAGLFNKEKPREARITKPLEQDTQVIAIDPIFSDFPSLEVITKKEAHFHPQRDINLHDLKNYFEQSNIVGEESVCLTATLALSNNMYVGIEGFSGSGKTYIADKIMNLFPNNYTMELASNQAFFYDAKNINEKDIIYIPELQKAMNNKNSPVIELVKNITEGKDAIRQVTKKNGVTEYKIDTKPVLYTLALENSFNKDTETLRRFLILKTNSSPEHIEEIHQQKASKRYALKKNSTHDLRTSIQHHLESVRKSDVGVIDPFADYITSIIPRTQKSIAYVDHYYNLVDACAKFNHNNRHKFSLNDQEYLLTNIEDHHTIYNLYYDAFIETINQFGETVEKKVPDWTACKELGKEVLANDPELTLLREIKPTIVEDWYRDQHQITNYKTGQMEDI